MRIDRVFLRRGCAPSVTRRKRSPWAVGLLAAAAAAVVIGCALAPIAQATSSFTFMGRGNGHGVGMSQWGAWQAAREGYTYEQILAFYYPNTALRRMGDVYGSADQTLKVRISSTPWTRNTTSFSQVDLKPTVSAATINGRTVPVGALVRVTRTGNQVKVTVDGVNLGGFNHVDLKPGGSGGGEGRINVQLKTAAGTLVDYREYWGTIRVQPGEDAGELWVYNFVALEKYVRSIAEVPYDWASEGGRNYAFEAVKAQAVAARTYAVAKNGATLADNWADQCYRGYSFEARYPGIARAAAETAGQILTHGGKAISAYFSGHSGGYTTASAWTGSNTLPYIVAQADPWSLRAPLDRPGWEWKYTISADGLSGKVNGSLKDTSGKTVNIGRITDVEIVSRETADAGSRARTLRLTGSKGAATVSASSLRSLLGSSNLVTTLIVSVNGDAGSSGAGAPPGFTGATGGVGGVTLGGADGGAGGDGPAGGATDSGGSGAGPLMPGEFYDVGPNHPYQAEISRVITSELMSGYENGLFKPDGVVTRAQFAKIAVSLYNIMRPGTPIVVTNATAKPFDDVPISAMTLGDVSDWIAAAKEAGLVAGVTSTTFSPHTEIQRDQMATMMCRALQWTAPAAALPATTPGFADVPYGSPHWAAATYLLTRGVLLGYADEGGGQGSSLGAGEPIKRQHVAVILCRVLDLEQ